VIPLSFFFFPGNYRDVVSLKMGLSFIQRQRVENTLQIPGKMSRKSEKRLSDKGLENVPKE